MKSQVLETVIRKSRELENNDILMGIVERATAKFFKKSNDEIVIYDVRNYVLKQLNWRKQHFYETAMPIIYEVCERLGQDFEMLFEEEGENWRDYYQQLEY